MVDTDGDFRCWFNIVDSSWKSKVLKRKDLFVGAALFVGDIPGMITVKLSSRHYPNKCYFTQSSYSGKCIPRLNQRRAICMSREAQVLILKTTSIAGAHVLIASLNSILPELL